MDHSSANPGFVARSHDRMSGQGSGELVTETGHYPLTLLDISCGGCKIRVPALTDGGHLAQSLPQDFVLTVGTIHIAGAIIWNMSGMFGCHFYDPILLETVASILGTPFKIRLNATHT